MRILSVTHGPTDSIPLRVLRPAFEQAKRRALLFLPSVRVWSTAVRVRGWDFRSRILPAFHIQGTCFPYTASDRDSDLPPTKTCYICITSASPTSWFSSIFSSSEYSSHAERLHAVYVAKAVLYRCARSASDDSSHLAH